MSSSIPLSNPLDDAIYPAVRPWLILDINDQLKLPFYFVPKLLTGKIPLLRQTVSYDILVLLLLDYSQ